MRIGAAIRRVLPVREGHAHCDIPCGIYDPIVAKIAAQTVHKMAMRIKALSSPTGDAAQAYTMTRLIAVKEHHAEICKREVDILWHDYFKPEHLTKYPDLHTLVWETTKLASANKQNVDPDSAQKLVEKVDKIAEIFWATKGVTYSDPNATVRFGK
ncbi:MAG: superoxide dismutase, Ni [SAR202 cluster bacterium]|nr:superoxide dismutase, Ni [SAR202 cluster bacterium]